MKNILLGALSAGKHHTGRGGKTGVLKVLIIIRIVDGSLTALTHSDNICIINISSIVWQNHCASIAILELCFQFMYEISRYFDPLPGCISHRDI